VDVLELVIEQPRAAPAPRRCERDSLIVGRTEAADIALADASVSRRHARLFWQDGRWLVEDLGSRNGTFLNSKPIKEPLPLNPDDRIRIGDTTLHITSIGDLQAASGEPTCIDAHTSEEILSFVRPAAEILGAADADERTGSRLRLLNEVHRALLAPVSRDGLLETVLERAFAILAPDHGAVFLKRADGTLFRAAERHALESMVPLLVSSRLADEVMGKGAAALVFDAREDERFASAVSIVSSGARSIVAAPLSDNEGCFGMMALYSNLAARRFSERDLELLVSLAWAAAIRLRNLSLIEEAAERRVIDRELALAREIQMGMLRRPSFDREGIDVAARLVPARSVGGDFYEFQADGTHLWFIVGDVAGKGMAAALMMVMAQTLFRAVATLGLPLDEVMARLNAELARDNERAMFVTALAGRLDLETGRLELANAGHNLPYRLRPDGTVEEVAAKNSLALGVLEEVSFPLTELALEAGEGLLLYTDGVSDAVNPEGLSFGVAGIEQHLRGARGLDAEALVAGLFGAIETFTRDAAQEDDITVAVLRLGSGLAPARSSYAASP
jgi:sigma-B regulation protein RsbU (phosphoserine phosphatase)